MIAVQRFAERHHEDLMALDFFAYFFYQEKIKEGSAALSFYTTYQSRLGATSAKSQME